MEKSVLITGASSGFGMNVALELARQGWRVFGAMRDPARGESLLDRSKGQGTAGQIALVALDVTAHDSIQSGVSSVLAQTQGRLDALVNNAGYSIIGAFEDMSDGDCRRQMETNFFGTLAVTRAVLPIMREAKRGRVVVISSNAVNTPHPMLSLYAASKWALEGWAEGLAMEVAPFGIQVALVQPGAHRTPFAQHVVPVMREGSPYQRWMEAATPGIGSLDRWGRDPELATAPIVRAVTANSPPFRTVAGEDTEIFSRLKGSFPYEVRAWLAREIVGLPKANQFVGSDEEVTASILEEIADRVVHDAASASSALRMVLDNSAK